MVDRIYSAVQNTCCADRDYASSTQSYGQVLNTYSAAHFANQLQQKTDKTVNTLTLLTDYVTVKQRGKQLLSHAQFLDCFGVDLVFLG